MNTKKECSLKKKTTNTNPIWLQRKQGSEETWCAPQETSGNKIN